MRNIFNVLVFAVFGLLGTSDGALAQGSGGPAPSSLAETYTDWVVRCVSVQDASGDVRQNCEMAQELSQQDSGQRILAMSIRAEGEGALMTLVAPFGLLLSDGLRMEVSEAPLFSVPFRTCLPVGCVASLKVDIPVIAALAAGDMADILLTSTGAQAGSETKPVKISLSLAGFTAAWNRVKTINR